MLRTLCPFRHLFRNISYQKKWSFVQNLSIITIVSLNRALITTGKICPKPESTRQTFQQLIGIARPVCACPARKLTSAKTPDTDKQVLEVNINQLREMLASTNLQLIDVREPYELKKAGKIPGAINIPLRKVPEAFTMDAEAFQKKYKSKKPEKLDSNIVFHCKAGVRSKAALEAVHQIGFKKAKHFPGGYDEWETCMKKKI